ncbi:hypothetical protein I7X12_04640 [Halosimplex litoreum]|uniref:Uncharacterized protein n=1 Tax=Halosimplex litoreum TaxID=1198301 RepID=A0A7T3KW95_9EURY|nr:hypothetical protein [Halosimplex litoreum]QPV63924.1 hypothetical protein I7X12_04640 [Halosimplex litoreum]
MDVRASSTAFDTVLFVLLVGIAVGTLAGVGDRRAPDGNRVAEETGDLLATTTAEVTYTRSARVPSSALLDGDDTVTVTVTRAASGTRAELLAAAAVADPSLGGASLTGTGENLRAGSRSATRRVLHTREANAQVAVTWRPYPNATLRSSFTVGDAPPRDADVSVATVAAASGMANVSAAARRAARTNGFGGVANVLADVVVADLFPPSETRDALYSEGPDRALVAHRYRRAATVLGVDTPAPFTPETVARANRRLSESLAERLARDLNRRYDSPTEAASAVRAHRVRVVVRTWSE